MLQIIGILLAFSMILILVNRKVALGYSLVVGAIVVGAFSGLGVKGIVTTFADALVDPITIRLVAVLALIGVLGHTMQKLGVLSKLVASLNKVLRSPKLTIAVLPSIMGTLLVTGGAIMAAPLVDEVADDLALSKPKRAAINLMFRHAWYFVYPLMPVFILVSEIANIDTFDLIKIQWPMTVTMVAIGYWMWIRPARPVIEVSKEKPKMADIGTFIKYSAPLWISLSLALGLEKVDWTNLGMSASASSSFTSMVFPLALCLGILAAVILGDKSDESIMTTIRKGIKIEIIFSGVGIMIFKGMVGQLTVLDSLVLSFLETGIPLFIIFITLPWLTGFLSASTTSAIGITLPILMPALALSDKPIPLIMLLYSSAFLGYLVSPLHLCQVLTLEYFKVKISDLYKEYKLIIPATFIVSIIVYFIVR